MYICIHIHIHIFLMHICIYTYMYFLMYLRVMHVYVCYVHMCIYAYKHLSFPYSRFLNPGTTQVPTFWLQVHSECWSAVQLVHETNREALAAGMVWAVGHASALPALFEDTLPSFFNCLFWGLEASAK